MRSSLSLAILATPLLSMAAFAQLVPGPSDAFQVRYASNVNMAGVDSFINITDAGTQNAGGICVNVYTFSPDEQLVSCCACPITPNGLASLSVNNDLVNNTLTPAKPNSVVVKLLATQGGGCNAATPTGGNLAAGMRAWGTTVHVSPAVGFATTETEFSPAGLSQPELTRITSLCGFIQSNGSGFGICNSCKAGGLGGGKK